MPFQMHHTAQQPHLSHASVAQHMPHVQAQPQQQQQQQQQQQLAATSWWMPPTTSVLPGTIVSPSVSVSSKGSACNVLIPSPAVSVNSPHPSPPQSPNPHATKKTISPSVFRAPVQCPSARMAGRDTIPGEPIKDTSHEVSRAEVAEAFGLSYLGLYEEEGPFSRVRVWRSNKGLTFYDCLCGKRKPDQGLKKIKHHALRHDINSHKCKECGKTYAHHCSLNAHMRVHKREAAAKAKASVFAEVAKGIDS